MKIEKLYELIEKIEQKEQWLFIVYENGNEFGEKNKIGIDVLEWETEDTMDGGWFNSVKAVFDFIKLHYSED